MLLQGSKPAQRLGGRKQGRGDCITAIIVQRLDIKPSPEILGADSLAYPHYLGVPEQNSCEPWSLTRELRAFGQQLVCLLLRAYGGTGYHSGRVWSPARHTLSVLTSSYQTPLPNSTRDWKPCLQHRGLRGTLKI